jgi:hypothetical protein
MLFAVNTLYLFKPGHIDHHGLNVGLITLSMGFLIHMMIAPDDKRNPIAAGLILAFSLVVALEVLPPLLVICAVTGLWGTVKGGQAAINAFLFALILFIGSAAGLLTMRLPGDFFTPDLLSYSIVYVILCGGIAVSFAGLAATAFAPAWLRWGVAGGLAVLCGSWFLHCFPDLVTGPYGGMDPALHELMLLNTNEAKPMSEAAKSNFMVFIIIASNLIALPASLYYTLRARPILRWPWIMMTVMQAAMLLLSVFYQVRFVGMASMLTIIPLTVLLWRGWHYIGRHYQGRTRIYAEIGLILLVGPLPGVLIPALVDGRNFNTGVLMFANNGQINACDTLNLERVLNATDVYGDHPRLIMNMIDLGPELLFRTQHSVLSAPFHMNVTGNLDAYRFFSTPYESEAESIIRRRGVELVVACREIPKAYLKHLPSSEVSNDARSHDFAPHMVERLMSGHVPPWLQPVYRGKLGNLVLYEVQPEVKKRK